MRRTLESRPQSKRVFSLHALYPYPLFRRLLAILTWALVPGLAGAQATVDYSLELITASSSWDGKRCWVHSRAGAIPPGTPGNETDKPLIVITTQKLDIKGTDLFDGLQDFSSTDLGKSWSGPNRQDGLSRRSMAPNIEASPCDFTPAWHAKSARLLGTGKTFWYRNNNHYRNAPSDTIYAVYDAGKGKWSSWRRLELPDLPQFQNCSAGCTQRYDLPGGDVLLPVYFKPALDDNDTRVTVLRCSFDGTTLRYQQHGTELELPDKSGTDRGLGEPSLTKFGERFFMTIRCDRRAYVSTSADGLHFDPPMPWHFDDGSELGSYNTQAHWVTHSNGLFIVYTRRGANNDHVFRHRAPLFMARVDPQKLVVLRDTERIIIPDTGTRMGNFGVVKVSPTQTWVITTEWMQGSSPATWEKYGTDNRIFCAKIHWDRINRLVP